MFPVRNHICNRISFCAHSKRAGCINTYSDIDISSFRNKCSRNPARLYERGNYTRILYATRFLI